jgi:hypothetical protein
MATRLQETVLLNEGLSADAVDENEGVIRGVALLGSVSKNKRRYSPKAMQDAARLYEGLRVNLDHRQRNAPAGERGFMEGVGLIRNARVTDDGSKVRGDLHYLKSHQASALIVESAKRFPAAFGFSHDAEGDTRADRDGVLVESLEKVHSLDIVGRPATNAGLFESEDDDMSKAKTRTISFQEAVEKAPEGKFKKRGERLLELEAVAAEMPVADLPAESDPNEDVKAALKKAGAAIVGKMIDGELDPSEALKKLKELVGMSEKMDSGDDSGDVAPPEMTESIKRLEARLNIADAKTLLLESKRAATPERIEAVALLAPEKRKKLVESWPAEGEKSGPRGRTGSILESYAGSDGPDSLKEVFGDSGPGYKKFAKKA